MEELVGRRRRRVNSNRLGIRRRGGPLKEDRQLGVVHPLFSRIREHGPSIENNADGEIGVREVIVLGIEEDNKAAIVRSN